MATRHEETTKIIVAGTVQGVGFRPYVFRRAEKLRLKGSVKNRTGQVEIFLQGRSSSINQFIDKLLDDCPPLAKPNIVSIEAIDCTAFQDFQITKSEPSESTATSFPSDSFMCEECQKEFYDEKDRRYLYPFINCISCGPRTSISKQLPYDREMTSMGAFNMCQDCLEEYHHPTNRRHHAQPTCCPVCGPQLNLIGTEQIESFEKDTPSIMRAARKIILDGGILCFKGVGGYQLMCDATNEKSVERLRRIKHRPLKPLAILAKTDHIDLGKLNSRTRQLLTDQKRPIVLMDKSYLKKPLADNVCSVSCEVGIMLPASPLHQLLIDDLHHPIVATSANFSGEAIIYEDEKIISCFKEHVDGILIHNRDIVISLDDPVYRTDSNRSFAVRLGRGDSPKAIKLPRALKKPVLALGGDLKSSIALGFHDRVILSPYIGDLDSLSVYKRMTQWVDHLCQFYQIKPELIISDLNPQYSSYQWAKKRPERHICIQHHRAHASSQHYKDRADKTTLALSWDGSGLGDDNSAWGGEAFIGRPGHWQRCASVLPFSMPGGDKAAKEPWRIACSLLWQAGFEKEKNPWHNELLYKAWQKDLNCPKTSSIGRLFDAVACFSLGHNINLFEGHGAMLVESNASAPPLPHRIFFDDKGTLIFDWRPMIRPLLQQSFENPMAAFHKTLEIFISQIIRHVDLKSKVEQLSISGGVFQNRSLRQAAEQLAQDFQLSFFCNPQLPCNDGSLAIGQIVEAMAKGEC